MKTVASFVAIIAFLSCSGQSQKSMKGGGSQTFPQVGVPIPTGQCRIVGTVVAIDSMLSAEGPCAKAPCIAIVRVDSVLGYGSAFPTPLSPGREIRIKFEFTVGPTSIALFPTMKEVYPGLRSGSRFAADVRASEMLGGGTAYNVYEYKLR